MRATFAVTLALTVMLCGLAPAADEKAPETIYEKGQVLYNQARQLQADKKLDEAAAVWLKLADEYPNHQYAEFALTTAAGLQRQLGQVDKALATCQRLLDGMAKGGDTGTTCYNIGSIYYGNKQDFAKAIEWYERASAVPGYNNASGALWQAIYCAGRAKDPDKVIALADTMLETFTPTGGYAMQSLAAKAQALIDKGDLDAVPTVIEKMTETAAGDYRVATTWMLLGNARRARKDTQKAADAFIKCAETGLAYDRGAIAFVTAGDVLGAEKPEEAIAAYRRYIDEHPKGQYAHYAYLRIVTVCRNNLKDRQQEANVCEEFLEKYPKSVYRDDMLMALAGAAATLEGQEEKVIGALKRVVENQQASNYRPTALLQLARLYRGKGENDTARQYYDLLIKDYPGWQYADAAARETAALK